MDKMNNPAASSGVSLGAVILFAASGGEFGPERLKHEPVPHDHDAFLKNAHKREGFTKAYNDFEEEYSLVHAMLSARAKSGLTQEAVAALMGTTKKEEIV